MTYLIFNHHELISQLTHSCLLSDVLFELIVLFLWLETVLAGLLPIIPTYLTQHLRHERVIDCNRYCFLCEPVDVWQHHWVLTFKTDLETHRRVLKVNWCGDNSFKGVKNKYVDALLTHFGAFIVFGEMNIESQINSGYSAIREIEEITGVWLDFLEVKAEILQ